MALCDIQSTWAELVSCMQQLQKKAKFRGVIFDNGPVYIQQPTGKIAKNVRTYSHFSIFPAHEKMSEMAQKKVQRFLFSSANPELENISKGKTRLNPRVCMLSLVDEDQDISIFIIKPCTCMNARS